MKPINLVVLCTGTLLMLSGVFGSGTMVRADEREGETKATVTVKEGPLSITKSDDIEFDAFTLNGQNQNDYAEKGKSQVTVEDYRNSDNVGWSLSVKLKDKGFTENGIALKVTPNAVSNSDVVMPGSPKMSLNLENQIVASVSDEQIQTSDYETVIRLGAALDIPAKVKAKSYSTTLVWNLQATPK